MEIGSIFSFLNLFKSIYNYFNKKYIKQAYKDAGLDPRLAEPATGLDIKNAKDEILKAVQKSRKQAIDISADIGISFLAKSNDKTITEPPEEAKIKAQNLFQQLESLRQSGKDLPISMELDKAIALVGSGKYEDGNKLIDDYIEKLDQTWQKLENQRNDEMALAYKTKGDAAYYQIKYKGALDYYLKSFGYNRQNYTVINLIGLCNLELAKFRQANKYFYMVYKIFNASQDIKTDIYAILLSNIASSLNLLGKYKSAHHVYMNAVSLIDREGDLDNLNYAYILNNFGTYFIDVGDGEKALIYFKKANDLCLRLKRTNTDIYIISVDNIGSALSYLGKYDEALSIHEEVLKYLRGRKQDNHSFTASTLINIANIYKMKGDYEKALKSSFEALNIDLEIHGKNHPDVAITYSNIGQIYEKMKKFVKALKYFIKALDIDLKIYGKEHLKIATRNNNIAHCYYSMGEPVKGLPYVINAFKIRYKMLGPDHHQTKNSRLGIQVHGGDPDVIESELRGEKDQGESK